MAFRLQLGETAYRILGPRGEEGEIADYGLPAFLEIAGATYMAFLDPEEDQEVEDIRDPLPPKVYRLAYSPETTELEDVKFDFEDGAGDDDGEAGGDGDDGKEPEPDDEPAVVETGERDDED